MKDVEAATCIGQHTISAQSMLGMRLVAPRLWLSHTELPMHSPMSDAYCTRPSAALIPFFIDTGIYRLIVAVTDCFGEFRPLRSDRGAVE